MTLIIIDLFVLLHATVHNHELVTSDVRYCWFLLTTCKRWAIILSYCTNHFELLHQSFWATAPIILSYCTNHFELSHQSFWAIAPIILSYCTNNFELLHQSFWAIAPIILSYRTNHFELSHQSFWAIASLILSYCTNHFELLHQSFWAIAPIILSYCTNHFELLHQSFWAIAPIILSYCTKSFLRLPSHVFFSLTLTVPLFSVSNDVLVCNRWCFVGELWGLYGTEIQFGYLYTCPKTYFEYCLWQFKKKNSKIGCPSTDSDISPSNTYWLQIYDPPHVSAVLWYPQAAYSYIKRECIATDYGLDGPGIESRWGIYI